MKNTFYILLLFSQVFFANNGFEKGNSLYQKGKYQEAITAYESVLANNKQAAELYFNLGNCYYKLNKVAPSIYYYEKALVLNPSDAEIHNNLKFAQKLLIDEVKEVPKVGFDKLISDFTSAYSPNTWAWITIVLAFLFLFFFIGYYFSYRTAYKRVFFIGLFFLLLLMLGSVFSAIYEKTRFEKEQPAIVFVEVATVKSEPKSEAPEAFVLHEGTKVFIKETLDNWLKIQLADGTEGWIESDEVKKVK